jgi:hypothetical protein
VGNAVPAEGTAVALVVDCGSGDAHAVLQSKSAATPMIEQRLPIRIVIRDTVTPRP